MSDSKEKMCWEKFPRLDKEDAVCLQKLLSLYFECEVVGITGIHMPADEEHVAVGYYDANNVEFLRAGVPRRLLEYPTAKEALFHFLRDKRLESLRKSRHELMHQVEILERGIAYLANMRIEEIHLLEDEK